MKRWMTFGLIVFGLHFAWEMSQADWFASMQRMSFWYATFLSFRAALGDLVITAGAFVFAAVAVRKPTWPTSNGVVLGGGQEG